MPQRIVIEPMTRIEGHLKIEVEVEDNKVISATLSGAMARGFESLLKGRDPRDAPYVAERICGVCFTAHGWTSSMAVEAALGTTALPEAARLVRNLLAGSAWLHDHVLHFYLLAFPDYLDILALTDYQGDDSALQKLKKLIIAEVDNQSGDGRYGAPFWPSYAKDEHCVSDLDTVVLLLQHYFAALKIQLQAKKMAAILGGKAPHQSAIVAGGVTRMPTSSELASFSSALDEQAAFIDGTYIKDVLELIAGPLNNLARSEIGVGNRNYLSCGGFPESGGDFLYPAGAVVEDILVATTRDQIEQVIEEDVTRSWYGSSSGGHPSQGEESFDLEKSGAHTFIKAARYDGHPMEVGPLARMMVAAVRPEHPAYNHEAVGVFRQLLDDGLKPGVVLRHAARAVETRLLIDAMRRWVDELKTLIPNIPMPIDSPQIHDAAHWNPPTTGQGCGMSEAPRGSLGHWIQISEAKISHYACVTPTTWNASPRDSNDQPGPLEQALVDCPVADPNNPIQVSRVVRSFDPCIACAVHVMTPAGSLRRFICIP